jgi:hypothetical protein
MFTETKIDNNIIAVSTLDYEKKFFKVEIYENHGLVKDYPGLHKGQLFLMREFTEDMVAHPEGALVHTRNWINKLNRSHDRHDKESTDYWNSNVQQYFVSHKACRFFFDNPHHPEVLKDFYKRPDKRKIINALGKALALNGIDDLNTQWEISQSLQQLLIDIRD